MSLCTGEGVDKASETLREHTDMGVPVDGTLPVHLATDVGRVYARDPADALSSRHPYLPQAHEAVFSSEVLPHEVGAACCLCDSVCCVVVPTRPEEGPH